MCRGCDTYKINFGRGSGLREGGGYKKARGTSDEREMKWVGERKGGCGRDLKVQGIRPRVSPVRTVPFPRQWRYECTERGKREREREGRAMAQQFGTDLTSEGAGEGALLPRRQKRDPKKYGGHLSRIFLRKQSRASEIVFFFTE